MNNMNLKAWDLFHLTKLTTHQVDHVTCLECCKYYIAPETATCGHTLCHTCWRGRRCCPSCAAPIDRRSLKLNLQLQNLTEHIHVLGETFEKLFNVKLDEFVLDETSNEVEKKSDPTKNVKDWLASSQNQFSAPIINTEPFSQEFDNPIELSSSKIQVHINSNKSKSPEKVLYVPPPQDDWDKIEQLPDTDGTNNNKENLTKQANKLFDYVGDEYTTDHPRRSSRKRDYVSQNEIISKNHDTFNDRQSSKYSNSESEKKSHKAKQNWNNVERMRKEFSKINKKNRKKLNVSIEMCKKTQNSNKPIIDKKVKSLENDSQPVAYTIEDNTPDINNIDSNIKAINKDKSNPNDLILLNNNQNNELMNESPNSVTERNTRNSNKKIFMSYNKKENNDIQENIPIKDTLSENITTNPTTSANVPLASTNTKVPFIKKVVLCPHCSQKNPGINIDSNSESPSNNLEDIEITFKVGNTLTNITIKRKNNDVQLRVNTDRGVQTISGSNFPIRDDGLTHTIQDKNTQELEINIADNNAVSVTQIENKKTKTNIECDNLVKECNSKKNTASADTATAQFEITESVEKELSNAMVCIENVDENNKDKQSDIAKVQTQTNPALIISKTMDEIENCDEFINDLDIFDNESIQEKRVQKLNKSKHAPSEILMPTVKTKSQKHSNKRERDINDDDEVPYAKKNKTLDKSENANNKIDDCISSHKDESMNYDVVMGEVFASIDADIEKRQKSANTQNNNDVSIKSHNTGQNSQKNVISPQKITKTNMKEFASDKYSENVFSVVEKDEEFTNDLVKKSNECEGSTQRHIDNLLTPGMCQDLISTNEDNIELKNKEHCTPFHEHDDSDKSVVEETPQKNVSFSKPKTISDKSNNTNQVQKGNMSEGVTSSQNVQSIINVSDTLRQSTNTGKDKTVIEAYVKNKLLETPLNINKFVDHIKHKSTPVARKSLNFNSENIDDIDPEQTLCPSSIVAKTTQEKEFMTKAFEQTPKSPVKKPLITRNINDLNYCIAGSCLSSVELSNVKHLCRKYNWRFADKYTRELTHLVVGVDEDNRSQRSVKYMCALAASKWIVSYEWVDACISTNLVVGESLYEVLDGTGEPGPKRSRLAKTKLFQGITFYCMPPFTVLDVVALKEMLESAGGRVVDEMKAVRVVDEAPALLLAEPEHTQEDRFLYLALELNIVPVNYEWVLNCLGSYSLSPIHELLMCPTILLPKATKKWPEELISSDN